MSLISPSRCLPAALICWRSGRKASARQVLGLLLEHLGVPDDGVERRPQLVATCSPGTATCAGWPRQAGCSLPEAPANSRAFSMAMTAWSANVSRSAICSLGERTAPPGEPSPSTPMASPPRISGTPSCEPDPTRGPAAAGKLGKLSSASRARGSCGDRTARRPMRRLDRAAAPTAYTGERRSRARSRASADEPSPSTRMNAGRVGAAQSAPRRDQRVEHLLEIGRRWRRSPAAPRRWPSAAPALRSSSCVALLQLLEQPGVLDGDDRLVRERLQQGNLLLGVWPYFCRARQARRSGHPVAASGTTTMLRCPNRRYAVQSP